MTKTTIMNMLKFKNTLKAPIITHKDLSLCLKEYKKPNDKIAKLIRDELIFPLKKGYYVFNENFSNIPLDKKILANLLYGPSYISYDYALYEYGLIPEYVTNITSATTRRKKEFINKFGVFTYLTLPLRCYSAGVTVKQNENGDSIFFATAEKALCDKIYSDKNVKIYSKVQLQSYLSEDIRLDIDLFLSIANMSLLGEISKTFNHRKIYLFLQFITEVAKGKLI